MEEIATLRIERGKVPRDQTRNRGDRRRWDESYLEERAVDRSEQTLSKVQAGMTARNERKSSFRWRLAKGPEKGA